MWRKKCKKKRKFDFRKRTFEVLKVIMNKVCRLRSQITAQITDRNTMQCVKKKLFEHTVVLT